MTQSIYTRKEVREAILAEMIEAYRLGQAGHDIWNALDDLAIRLGLDVGDMLAEIQEATKI